MITLETLATRKLERKLKRETSLRQRTIKGTTKCSGDQASEATDGFTTTGPLPTIQMKAPDQLGSTENKFQKVVKTQASSCIAVNSRPECEVAPVWLRRWRLMGKEWKRHFGLEDSTDVSGKKLDGPANKVLKEINSCSYLVKPDNGGNTRTSSVLEVPRPTRRSSVVCDVPSKKVPCDKRQVGRSHPYQEKVSQENNVVRAKDTKSAPKPAAKRQNNKEKCLRAELEKLQTLPTAATYREHRLRKQKEDLLIRELSKYDVNETLLNNIDVFAQNVLCSPKAEETDNSQNSPRSGDVDSSEQEIRECETQPTSQECRRDSTHLCQNCDQSDSVHEDSTANIKEEDDQLHRASTGVSAESTEHLQESSMESRSDELGFRRENVVSSNCGSGCSKNDSILRDIAPDLACRLSTAMRNGRYDNTIKESRKRKSPSDEFRNYLPSKKPFYTGTGFVGYYERF